MSLSLRLPLTLPALFLSTVALAAPAPAGGKAVTLPYSAKAQVVVQVNGLENARDRLKAMLANAFPGDNGKIGKQIDKGIRDALEGRKLTAIPKAGRTFVIIEDVSKISEDDPAVAVLIPVTSYKEFRDSFLTADEKESFEAEKTGVDSFKTSATGQQITLYVTDLKEYIAVSPSKNTIASYKGKFTPASTDQMGPELAASFLAADVSIFVNTDAINDVFGEKIREGKTVLDFLIGQAQMGGMVPGLSKKQIEGFKEIFNGMFQGLEDSRGLLLGLEFRPEGANLRIQAQFAKDTVSGKLMSSELPTPLTDLSKLPAAMSNYTGWKFGKKITNIFKSFSTDFAAAEDEKDSAEKVESLLADLAKATPEGAITGGSNLSGSLTVSSYKDPKAATKAITDIYSALTAGGKISTVVLKRKPKVKSDAQSVANISFTEVALEFDLDATVKDLPEQLRETTLAAMKRMMPEKLIQWIGTDGKLQYTLTAKNWETASKLLTNYLDGKGTVGDETGFQITRKNLPADANSLSFQEAGQMIQSIGDYMKQLSEVPGLPIHLGELTPVKAPPTYIGFAVVLKGETATLDVFVPAAAVNVFGRSFSGMFKNVQ